MKLLVLCSKYGTCHNKLSVLCSYYGYGYVRSTGTDAGLVRNRYGRRKGTGTGVVHYGNGHSTLRARM